MKFKYLMFVTLPVAGIIACSSVPSGGDNDSVGPAQSLASSVAPAQPRTPVDLSSAFARRREVAQASLVRLRGLAQARNKQMKMGLRTPEDINAASLDDGLSIFRVSIDSLRGYRRGDEVGRLMIDTESAFYPATVDGKAVSGVVVGKQGGQWRMKSFGRPTWAHALQITRERITASRGVTPSNLAFVEVETPATVLLIRHVEGNAVFLTSVVDLPEVKFHSGEVLRAEEAIERLQLMIH